MVYFQQEWVAGFTGIRIGFLSVSVNEKKEVLIMKTIILFFLLFCFTISNIYSQPVITSKAEVYAVKEMSYSYDVDAAPPNIKDKLTYSLDIAPSGMIINAVSGKISWTPASDQAGSHNVTVRATDTGGLFSTQSFDILVYEPMIETGLIVTDLRKAIYTLPPEKIPYTPYNLYYDDTDTGGNTSTSIRNDSEDHIEWKSAEGYYQRNRDLGTIFNPDKDIMLDAIVLRTSGSYKAVKTGAPGAPVIMQIFEVVGTPRLDDNGTGPGDKAEGRYGSCYAMDDYVADVKYVPLLLATGGVFPDFPVTSKRKRKGKLRFMRWDITDDMLLIGDKRYMFVVGFENAIYDCSIALANSNPVKSIQCKADPVYLFKDSSKKEWWGVRREGTSTYPPTRAPGSDPIPEPNEPLKSLLKTESLFNKGYLRYLYPPDSDGYPSIDTYRKLQYYIEADLVKIKKK